MAIRTTTSLRHIRGVTMIEVMIAAVVLATGLMALAALQASLSRNAADARARSQVAAFVESVIERQRAAGASSFANIPSSTVWTAAERAAVEAAAGVSSLTVAVTANHFQGQTGTFVACDATCAAGLKPSTPQYKRIDAVATWLDANGQSRRFEMATVVSPRTVMSSGVPFAAPTNGLSSQASSPIVVTPTPVQPGVIPIAIGDGSDTAATNPKPTISSGNVIRTSYEVLTYRNEGAGLVTQQRRVETAIISCSCAANRAATGAQFEYPLWPSYWNGERFVIYEPAVAAEPAGVAVAAGPIAGVVQDELCIECCRDHHDASGTTHVKFDPFRTDAHMHYKMESGLLVEAGSGDAYLEACRMVRVDGFWRTAQDLDSKHFGLLETANFAASAQPGVDPIAAYESFAIDFLKFNYLAGQTAQSADAVYESKGLNAPASININRPSPRDERYMHARGLYVDNVEPIAAAKIARAVAACTRVNRIECVMPFLSFTSINVTEPTFWATAQENTLTVDSDGFVLFNPSLPNRGRVNAISTAPANATAVVNASIQRSNSGLAVRPRGIDPQDDVDSSDTQTFRVQGGAGSAVAGTFTVAVRGLTDTKTPGVTWQIGAEGNNCQGTGSFNYSCKTSVALGVTTKVSVGAYNRQDDVKQSATVVCPINSAGVVGPTTLTYTPSGQNTVRMCRNFAVGSVTSPVLGVPLPVVGATQVVVRPDKVGGATRAASETTEITIPALLDGSALTINFVWQNGTQADSSTVAPVAACTFKNNGSLGSVSFQDCP